MISAAVHVSDNLHGYQRGSTRLICIYGDYATAMPFSVPSQQIMLRHFVLLQGPRSA
jgi:hypothetical protein